MKLPPDSAHTERLLHMGFVSHVPGATPWAERIGQFLFNFGGIELLTQKYLVQLEPDESAFDASLVLSLQQRIERILVLLPLATHLPQLKRDIAIRDWGEIKKMCLWRNHIAHNPVLPWWGSERNPATDPPDGITMPDLRQLKDGGGVHVTLETLSLLIEVSANLSRRLVETANTFPRSLSEEDT